MVDVIVYDAEGKEQGVYAWGPPSGKSPYEIQHSVLIGKVDENGNIKAVGIRELTAVYTLTIEGERKPEPKPEPDDGDDEDETDPTEAPFPSPNGLSFLIIREATETGSLEPSQMTIFTSSRLLQFGNQHAKGAGGFFRIWDDDHTDEQLNDVPHEIKVAYQTVLRSGKPLPLIAIANGDRGYLGPLPKTLDDTMKLLERYK